MATVEAGQAKVDNYLVYFTHHISKLSRTISKYGPRLSIEDFAGLYQKNQHAHGNHFVIHQHNHPRAGVHYDLRLQFSKTSSLSFAVPKGLPGDPNSKQQGRMAIETRVHNLWNHLIESASLKTGSLLIWDTGTYSILPRKTLNNQPSPQTTDDESDADIPFNSADLTADTKHENEKLIEAFQGRYIRLRLQGTRLPENYTISLRLPSANDISNPHQVRRRRTKSPKRKPVQYFTDSESEGGPTSLGKEEEGQDMVTDDEEDFSTRVNNAYPGSTNSIGSKHQRRWFMSLDRQSSGFVQNKSGAEQGKWSRSEEGGGFEAFYIRGREFERSVVTGRLAAEVEADEGVEGYVGRAGWMGITE
ncbi:hypothetical protein K505DRAFT_412094 [Melanomma pulvis-pyrius CBS 109.77]|uniref:DNA ligase D 3'-phosphoesterase domain-containing protein n=1 Tax=Melanomma pulvis-pyrius CBS 109.77 TaxID=1314802 RepID=A0A6A6WQH6_9PLEO|nr:hypothetical protein K505DRAFT_412094 [Melanomma pulvis-pyrius CBS 109.77]